MPPPPRGRGRPSASATTASPSAPSAPHALPAYQPPSHPLSATGQRSLAALTSQLSSSATTATKLKEQLRSANDILGEVADNINEMAGMQAAEVKRRSQKRAVKGEEGGGEEEAGEEERVREMERTVDGLTVEIEGVVRRLIDTRARVDAREKVLGEVVAGVGDGLGGGGGRGTQSTLGASQFRKGVEEDEDEEEGEGGEGSGPGPGPGVPELFKEKLGQWEGQYGAMGMREKYATHNDYISFKKSLHSGLHANTENPPPVPHSNSWFRAGPDGVEGPHALLSRQAASSQAGDEEAEGSDVEAVAVSINIKCPITLLPMKDPVTSKKCPHSFEKSAIEEMINFSRTQTGGSGRRGVNDGTRALRCPVCSVLLTTADLAPDPVLRRNIQRIVAAEQARNNRDEDEDYARHNGSSPQNRAQSIDSDYEGRKSLAPQVKAEKVRSSMMRSSVVPNTQLGKSANGRSGEDLEGDED